MFKSFFGGCKLTKIIAVAFLAAFMIWSVKFPLNNGMYVGAGLQLVFIVALIGWRVRKKSSLLFIPDEMLLCLPYFWALANSGSAQSWFIYWKFFLLPVFALSMFSVIGCKTYFMGGFRSNSLLQAIFCAIAFVMILATGLYQIFPSFSAQLYRVTLLNLFVFFAGIPISLAAFYNLEVKVSASDGGKD